MNEDTFHFGDGTFVAVYDARKEARRTRCYSCAFYGLFCLDKRRAGVIPQCEAIHRADRRDVYFVRERAHVGRSDA